MSLFRKKQQPLIAETGYDDVVTYLRDLAQADYTKILKVVNIYRDADKGVKKVLGIKDMPALDDVAMGDLLSDDDTSLGNFLDDEPVKTTTVKVTNASKAKGKKK